LILKISPLIGKYLQENKSLTLEGFGRFYLEQNPANAEIAEKHSVSSLVHYEYLPAAPTDPDFINYIIKETGKIRPLAIADLETFISLAKQLLNISKPFVIDGVGTLTKNTPGTYDFIPGNYEPMRINTDNERDKKLRQAKEVNRESEIRYSKNYEDSKEGDRKGILKKVLGAVTLLLLVAGAGWAIYYFVFKKGNKTAGNPKASIVTGNKDTGTSLKQTAAKATIPTNQVPDSLGRYEYKAVIKTGDSANAYGRYKYLTGIGQNVVIYKADSVNYKVAVLVRSLPQDTAKVAETTHSYFLKGTKYSGFRVYLEQ
jgi:hypothetical protein